MSTDEALSDRLEAFLITRGATRETIVAAVDEPFGRPLLLVATGSILHGFGNQRSDIDVNVVVEREVTRLPVPSYTQHVLLDTAYFGASEVEKWVSAIRDHPWPPAGRLDGQQWAQRLDKLLNCTRFGYGLMLSARDGWDRWWAQLREPWLIAQVAQWWQIESVRKQVAGRWLAHAKPLLAAQRQLEAVLAALESRAAAFGQHCFGGKWLSEKLRALGDNDGLAALRAVMRVPTTEGEVRSYTARCEALLKELGHRYDDGLTAQIWYLSGVKVRELDARTLVSRWNFRGIELRGTVPVPEPTEPFWEGELDALPPSDVLALFVEDFTWLSIIAKAS